MPDFSQEVILEVQRSMGRLEGKTDALIMQLTDHIKKDEMAWARVNSMDKKWVWFSGAVAGIAFFIAPVLKKIGLL